MHRIKQCFIFIVILLIQTLSFADLETPVDSVPTEEIQRFSNALYQIKKYYVKPVSDKQLFNNAIQGMLTNLDPHSAYLDEEEYKDLQTTTRGEFGGLGIEVTMEEGIVKVVTPIIEGPAFKVGIKAGDYIVKLGQQSFQGISLKDAVALMRGQAGTKIELTVLRKGYNKPLNFIVVRENITIHSVRSKLLANNYGYLRLTQFQSQTAKEMLKAINKLKDKRSLNGLILDLRNNPGGLLDGAIAVADAFIDADKPNSKLIVYTQGRLPSSRFSAFATKGDVVQGIPMVVLINSGSASAAEIVAGALKDNKRAIIAGTQSFGKGSVQTVLPLDEKSGIKLTTALYYTPAGISIQATGISPDIIIEEIEIPKTTKTKDSFLGFSEAALNGHIDNHVKNSPIKPAQYDANLFYEDYQLYAALNILKGLSIIKK